MLGIHEKYGLTIKEAAAYFSIGENKIRELIKIPGCDFVYYVGKKAIVIREKLEKFLEANQYL